MTNKNITIDLFRVDKTSKNLDIMFTCPNEYYFTKFSLEVRILNSDRTFSSQHFDLAPALFNNDPNDPNNTQAKKDWVVRIPLDKLGIIYPAIYTANLQADLLEEFYDDLVTLAGGCTNCVQEEITRTAICSDVNGVYRCLLKDLLKSAECDPCAPLSDEIIRNYLILYGHHAALAEGNLEEAEEYFKILSNCFAKCMGDIHCGKSDKVTRPRSSCNCK